MAYQLVYHPAVLSDDLPSIPRNLHQRIARAIEQRLTTEPAHYGEPLRYHLKGFWKLRVGDYRVVYKMVGYEVWIYRIDHRGVVYSLPPRRLVWKPSRLQ